MAHTATPIHLFFYVGYLTLYAHYATTNIGSYVLSHSLLKQRFRSWIRFLHQVKI